MNDTSRQLRYALGALCERYNGLTSDKDALDYRLGSNEPYAATVHGVDAEAAYLSESQEVSTDLRSVIIEMIDVGQRIRAIEKF